ncbi:Agmatine coumaroyltransferase-2 [Acorus gramineus]|uniref:Agmatine coumaroyltransferase-2 n=1 Tax=Acorus gramineus TaxID=55184 RepID=A0AAV9A789_ACOGR|nr:Agmatine coumaroyltransferase-2 [Acorus gramineus]
MKVKKQISKLLKPNYEGKDLHSTSSKNVPLSIFDTLTFDTQVAIIYAYRPPNPSNSTIEKGLAKALAEYREWAGRLGEDTYGKPVILLNDKGVRFVESTVDCTLEEFMPFKPSSTLLTLHPPLERGVEELVQVQLTRFTCGSLAVGFTAHHLVADGQATSNFLVAWGRATRGVNLGPLPTHDRTIFRPRNPPQIEFEHRGVEYEPMKKKPAVYADCDPDVIVHKTHYTEEFLMKLKSKASVGTPKPYSTFESLLAHLWRATTKARRLSALETTQVRISVNGRSRLGPGSPGTVSNDYFGNLVLWAFPRSQVKTLVSEPIQYAARLIHEAIAKVDGDYFRSFIDFANSGAVEKEGLVTTADMTSLVLCPNLEVDSWLRFPFYDLDFGGGCPDLFMPTYSPVEGMLFLVPSFVGDGSIDVYVPLHEKNMTTFKQICYNVD